jgi:hypothetical protein
MVNSAAAREVVQKKFLARRQPRFPRMFPTFPAGLWDGQSGTRRHAPQACLLARESLKNGANSANKSTPELKSGRPVAPFPVQPAQRIIKYATLRKSNWQGHGFRRAGRNWAPSNLRSAYLPFRLRVFWHVAANQTRGRERLCGRSEYNGLTIRRWRRT